MPSMLHEGLLLLFRNRPTFAPELLRDVLHVPLPSFTEARVDSADLTEAVPAEYHADLVVLLLDGKPVFAIIVEVQLSRDDRKHRSWPVYVTSLAARLDCPAALLVVAPDAAIAKWASRPIETGHPGFVLRPLVMGPSAVPFVTDPADVARDPELAVLSAMAHGSDEATVEVAKALSAGIPGLDAQQTQLYLDLVVLSLSHAARAAFEALMQTNYEYQSDFARKYYGEGRQKGLEEGIEQGLLDGERRLLVRLLRQRFGVLPQTVLARLEAAMSSELDQWGDRIVTADTLADVFGDLG